MIDIENKVFDTVYSAVTTADPDATVLSDTAEQASRFPVVTVNEINNATVSRTMTDDNREHHVQVTYEINVYADNQTGHKTKCKQLLSAADAAMLGMRFTRKQMTRLPNVDRTIYRMYARYSAIVQEPTVTTDGETVTETYNVYRR